MTDPTTVAAIRERQVGALIAEMRQVQGQIVPVWNDEMVPAGMLRDFADRWESLLSSDALQREVEQMKAERDEARAALTEGPEGVLLSTGLGASIRMWLTASARTREALRQRAEQAEAYVEQLKAERDEAAAWSELVTRGKSPCGHWKVYANTEDGGKHIDCWQCRAEQAEAQLATAREALEKATAECERGLDRLKDKSYGVDVRDKWGSANPVIATVVHHSDAMHELLFVRTALRAALGLAPAPEQEA